MLGILTLDTAFPRVRGDVGNPDTFAFPVRHATVAGASVDDIVHRRRDALLPQFVATANELIEGGCIGITTTCGFLVRWQRELAAELEVPVLTSSLLQVPLVQRCLPRHRRVGVVTYSAADLSPEALEAAGADPYTPVAGVDPRGYFFRTIRHGAATIDEQRMTQDVVAAARRLVAEHRDLGAVVLECANMPPYRQAVELALELPVFDAALLIGWFHAGIAGSRTRYSRHKLW
ncbi:MAG: aspartate/glutamate racemase family protein [Burkholderiales bacterium]